MTPACSIEGSTQGKSCLHPGFAIAPDSIRLDTSLRRAGSVGLLRLVLPEIFSDLEWMVTAPASQGPSCQCKATHSWVGPGTQMIDVLLIVMMMHDLMGTYKEDMANRRPHMRDCWETIRLHPKDACFWLDNMPCRHAAGYHALQQEHSSFFGHG